MPRAQLIKTSFFPYHITNRSNNKDFFYLPLEELWAIFCEKLLHIQDNLNCRVHCFVLMSNHYHLVVSTPNENIGESMKYFHREVARNSNYRAGRINHFFGGRYKWTVISNQNYYWNAVKYVFRNPVEAKITYTVTEYKYSSLNTEFEKLHWRMDDMFSGIENIQLDLNWLNLGYQAEQLRTISAALRRRKFELPRTTSGKIPLIDLPRFKKGTVTYGGGPMVSQSVLGKGPGMHQNTS